MTTESEIEDTASSATVTIPAVANKKTDYYENISGFGVADWFHGMFCNGPWMSDRNFNLVMPKEFNNYHPYVCNCCKRGPLQNIDLFRCSSCKVMKYCSRDHQRKDWSDHKLWCKSYVKVMNEEDEKAQLEQGHGLEDIDSWRSRMMIVNEHIMGNMCRLTAATGSGGTQHMMHTNHIQVAMLQPSCHKCLRTGRPRRVCQDDDDGDDDGAELIVCPHCSGVAVCKRCLGDHQGVMEWSCFHDNEEECKKYLISLCCSGMIVENGTLLLVTSDTNIETTIYQPKDWNEYFHKKGADFDVGAGMPISVLRKMPPISAFLTDGLTFPLTIQHILGCNNLSILNNTTKDKLCIHVLGAAASEYTYQRSWVELGRINPQLKQIDIVLVGPDLDEDDEDSINFEKTLLPHEKRLNCCGTIHKRHGLYHERRNDLPSSCPPPDLLVAFHSGITEHTHFVNWYKTLQQIASEDVPFCITGYNHKEVSDDVDRLTTTFGMKVMIPPTANPFRGMRPYLDPAREGSDFTFGNASYAVVK